MSLEITVMVRRTRLRLNQGRRSRLGLNQGWRIRQVQGSGEISLIHILQKVKYFKMFMKAGRKFHISFILKIY